ncbi:hypothetical protein C8R44DRAFT_611100 [Mycena epipterygia]|nr:hypothetical protein C8R44DRAFT_611100 [Mycena epipterygia]
MSLVQSPVKNHLHTNYVPYDGEIAEIHAYLEGPLHELAQIARQTTEEKELTSLACANHLNTVDAHMALLSPMRRVPLDILQEIFLCCFDSARSSVIDAREAPMLLGCICRHWRSIAYSTPRP